MHLYHLSEQPMQGSMDKVITGTSAISQPGNIASKAGTLAKVGVRIFNLSR
jgi:methylthioribose-1-phosphate isomerase